MLRTSYLRRLQKNASLKRFYSFPGTSNENEGDGRHSKGTIFTCLPHAKYVQPINKTRKTKFFN